MIVTTKILLEIPILYSELIYDEFVGKGKYNTRKDFIVKAIEEKFAKEKIDLEPKQRIPLSDWWDEKDNHGVL